MVGGRVGSASTRGGDGKGQLTRWRVSRKTKSVWSMRPSLAMASRITISPAGHRRPAFKQGGANDLVQHALGMHASRPNEAAGSRQALEECVLAPHPRSMPRSPRASCPTHTIASGRRAAGPRGSQFWHPTRGEGSCQSARPCSAWGAWRWQESWGFFFTSAALFMAAISPTP